jgi:hypothetical protein
VEHIAVIAIGRKRITVQDVKLVKVRCSMENVALLNVAIKKGFFTVVSARIFPVRIFKRHLITLNMVIVVNDWRI